MYLKNSRSSGKKIENACCENRHGFLNINRLKKEFTRVRVIKSFKLKKLKVTKLILSEKRKKLCFLSILY